MKKSNYQLVFKGFLVFVILATTLSCSKKEDDLVVPKKDETKLKEDVSELDIEGTVKLVTNASSVVETANGYKVEGSISADIENVGMMEIGEGEFEYTVDGNGDISSIVGVGTPKFPNVGIFAKILKEFSWEFAKSHIEYRKGSYYKSTTSYNTDIPLNDDRMYLHYQVFDESNDQYGLRNIGNKIIYNFQDLYIDPTDPAIFFKTQIPWPEGEGAAEATNILSKFWNKVTNTIPWKYADSPGVVLGISNQATIKSESYEFSKPERFQELFGNSGFDEINSHTYLKLSGIPLPPAPIFTMTGEMFVHRLIDVPVLIPGQDIEEQHRAVIDWFTQREIGPYAYTFKGSMDFGGEGIGLVLTVLQGLDGLVGKVDFLNDDFNLDLIGATFQTQYPDLNRETPAFMRFGGEIKKPMLAKLFGPEISKFIPSQPSPNGFLYLSIGDALDKWSLYIESSADLNVPVIGMTEMSDSYFLLRPGGIQVEGKLDLPDLDGIFTFDQGFKGEISREGFDFESEYNKEISLPNGIVLTSKNTYLHVSSASGFTVNGSVDLPLGIAGAEFSAVINKEKASFEGSINQEFDIGNNIKLPSKNMTFRTSTDPNEGISFEGELNVPHIGFTKVTGYYNKTGFEFSGVINGTIDFNGVNLPVVNGQLTINPDGIFLDGLFTLPYGLKTAQMSGSVTGAEIKLSGSLSSGITISGYTFQFSNSYINASSISGVNLGGNLNLKVFTASVSGSIYPGGSFKLTGSKAFNTSVLKTSINIAATQSKIDLTGSGTITSPVWPYPSYTGTITFKPNWGAGTIDACIGSICVGL